MLTESIKRSVREVYPLPANLNRIVNLAAFDLYYGPIHEADDGKPWPGFSGSLDAIRSWLDKKNLSELWVDDDCGAVYQREPDPYWVDEETGESYEECYDNMWHLEYRDVLRCVLCDNELVGYI